MNSLRHIQKLGKSILVEAFLVTALGLPALCNTYGTINDSTLSTKGKPSLNLQEHLRIFYPLHDSAEYTVTVCADLPVNDKPECVYKKGEPGHVFLILSRKDPITTEVITRSFGFYPRFPVTFIKKQVRSKILDNSDREYNASLEKKLTACEFALILEKCKELTKKKYNLKKYNCYDYVLEIFNSIPGIEKLPVTYVKFPFILGRGGSPCGLYSDLKKLLSTSSAWKPFIKFGLLKSPSSNPQNQIASFEMPSLTKK